MGVVPDSQLTSVPQVPSKCVHLKVLRKAPCAARRAVDGARRGGAKDESSTRRALPFWGAPPFNCARKVWGELARFSTRFRNIRGGCTPETRHPPRMLRKRVENLASFPQPFRAQLVGVLARQISDLSR